MDKLSQMNLGATVLSIALAAGFVAFGVLVFRVLVIGVSALLKKLKKSPPIENKEVEEDAKGFKILK